MFEVQDLRYATLATVSRCGMVWFSEDVLTSEMIFENFLQKLRSVPVEESDEDFKPRGNYHSDFKFITTKRRTNICFENFINFSIFFKSFSNTPCKATDR